jgi:hypothetical protein
VALFVGAIALLGTWLLLSSDATVSPTERSAGDVAERMGKADGEAGKLHDLEMKRLPRPAIDLQSGGSTVDQLRARGINVDRMQAPVSGSLYALDSDGVAAAVASRSAGLDGCYGTALLHTPDLPPAQSFTVHVAPKEGQTWGTITSVEASGAAHGTVLEGCAANVLGEVRFSDVSETTTLTVPVTLRKP